jgi:4-amino-4-deoxy-L-arabinose transferase-like glycosyltransferase
MGLLTLLVLSIRAPLMDLPLERDEGEYAYIAWRMNQGEIPYRDWFDQKPPGVFFAYQAALALPGEAVVNFRLVAAIFAAVSSVALFLLLRALFGYPPAILGAVLLAFQSSDPWIQGAIANTEIFMLPGIIIASIFFLRSLPLPAYSRGFMVAALGAGVLLGCATLFKQVAGVHGLLLVALVPCFLPDGSTESRWLRMARFAGWMALGGALAWGGVLAWFAAHGALHAGIDAILMHNLDYVSGVSVQQRFSSLVYNARPMAASQGPALLVGLAGLALLCAKRQRLPALLLCGWALTAFVGVAASGHFFPHYFQQLLPPLAAGAAACIAVAVSPISRPVVVKTALVSAVTVLPLLVVAIPFWLLPPAEAMRRIYPGNPFYAMPEVAREIAAISEPNETVFVFGTEPELYFYAKRVAASKYIHLFPLFGPYSTAADRQRETLAQLEQSRPAVVVWWANLMFFDPVRDGGLVDWMNETLASDYRLHAVIATRNPAGQVIVRVPEEEANGPEPRRRPPAAIYLRR